MVEADPDTIEDILEGFDSLMGLEDDDDDEDIDPCVEPIEGQDSPAGDEAFDVDREYLQEGKRYNAGMASVASCMEEPSRRSLSMERCCLGYVFVL